MPRGLARLGDVIAPLNVGDEAVGGILRGDGEAVLGGGWRWGGLYKEFVPWGCGEV